MTIKQAQCPKCWQWFEIKWLDVLPPGGYWWVDNVNGGGCPKCGETVLVETECCFREVTG